MLSRKWYLLFFFGLAFSLWSFETREVLDPKTQTKYFQVENDCFRLEFNPIGGRLKRFYFKPGKMDLTDPSIMGSCTENIWNVPASRFFLREKPFRMQVFRNDKTFTVEMQGNHKGGGIDFLQVTKKYILSNENAALRISYDFANLYEAMAKLDYAILLHYSLGIPTEPCSYFYPTEDGITVVRPDKRPLDLWLHRPARGWMAAASASGRGIAVTMNFPEVKCFYSWFSKDLVPTMEWRMIPVGIEAGKSFSTTVELIPFTGLREIAGAGNGLVGEISAGNQEPEPGDQVPLEIKVYNAYRGKVSAELFARRKAVKEWKKIRQTELDFKKSGSLQTFRAEVTQDQEGLLELEVILRNGEKELARLNSNVNFGESEEKWSIAPLEKQRDSSIRSIDLTVFNHVARTAHIPWAKPLPGKKLKVLALTAYNNLPEISQLAQRLDMEQTTTYLLLDYGKTRKIGNPIYTLGDYFGLLTSGDVENNLRKVLKSSYDAILIGGLPWEMFPEDAQQQILEKIRNGTGLLFIGPENGADFLGLKGKSPGSFKAQPVPVTDSFPVMGIPFELLGNEPVYGYSATDGIVHAKAGAYPYLVEKTLGRGRVLALTYRATFGRFNTSCGLTPDLQDRYPDHASMHEFYYSLIAKCLCHAARYELPVLFQKAAVGKLRAEFSLKNAENTDSEWEILIMNRYQQLLHREKRKIALKQGLQNVKITFPVTQYAGKQSLSLLVRDSAGNVLNWGSWTLEENPSASIQTAAADRKFYDHGETVCFHASVSGNPAGKTLCAELIDSFGRTLDRKESPAKSENSGSMKIANDLPARFYDLRITLRDNGREMDRRSVFLFVRPTPQQLRWDDYEIGTWMADDGARKYLWRDQAEILNRLHMRTLISNWEPLAVQFPVRYNFHPTLLASVGLSQRSEPPEYTKTGNKMLLARKPCLSDPAFQKQSVVGLESAARKMRGYALRFYWLGDEQSITGYNGLPADFCFSRDCLREFRTFLKHRYSTLEKLNRAWDTSFKAWEEVLPMTRKEVWENNGKHVAGWADHLEFMDGRLENIVRLAGTAAHKIDPQARISISGTQGPSAYGGMDWWREMKVFDSLMNYFVGGQEELQRSFSPACEFMPWSLGYSMRGDKAVYKVWETIFLGFRGIMGFAYSSLVNPDWTLSQGMKDALPHLVRISEGTGMHILQNFRTEPEIAVLYSQASIRAAFIENRKEEHRILREKYIRLLRNLGFEFNFISYEQLENGILDQSTFQALILPDSTALSDREIEAIQKFAAKGKTVIAEGIPGTREANCRPRRETPLRTLFQNQTKHLLISKINTEYLRASDYPDVPENAQLIQKEQTRLENALLQRAGIRAPRILLRDFMTKKRVRHAMHYARADRNGNRFFGVLTSDAKQRQVDIVLPEKAHVYNLVNQKYYGNMDQLRLPLSMGTPYAFVLMKQRPEIESVNADGNQIAVRYREPVDTVIRLRVFAPDGSEVSAYSRNLPVRDGQAGTRIPFALSDPHGTWRIAVEDIISGSGKDVSIIY